MLKRYNYPVHRLNLKWNLTHMGVRGIIQEYLFLNCGWIYHFNGFDKKWRKQIMKDTWKKMKERDEIIK